MHQRHSVLKIVLYFLSYTRACYRGYEPKLLHNKTRWLGGRVYGCTPYDEHMSDHNLGMYAKGNPHIAYNSNNLYYAWNDGKEWHIQTVIVDDVNISIALDSEGFPNISYTVGFGYLMFDSDYPEKEMSTIRPPPKPIPTEAPPTITPEPGDDEKLFMPLTLMDGSRQ